MKTDNYNARIQLYYQANPRLSHEELAVLLTADLLYKDVPEDLVEFRKKYAHMDPDVLQKNFDGIIFLKIVNNGEPEEIIRDRLNTYLNIKFHDIVNSKSYVENAVIFQRHSMIASQIIDDILATSGLPRQLIEVLGENPKVRSCYDFFEMLMLYRMSDNAKVKYELMRKLGLIVLIARINRSVEVEELPNKMKQVKEALRRGLGSLEETSLNFYFWLNAEQEIESETDATKAAAAYDREMKKRRQYANTVTPLQSIMCHPFQTSSGNKIVHMEIRNKFGNKEYPSYTSFVEKMLRKNLEFPNQVHDTIGVKLVVNTEDEIPRIISALESFLGGSSTRKMEKNTYHQFGRRGLSDYSSKAYFVWKAIYDITLPHPSIAHVEKMLEITTDNKQAQEELAKRLHRFVNNPRDFVIEVQLQDIKSYLLSIAEGSPTEHAWLKTNQIRSNSFYKFFPKEVFQEEINLLNIRLLNPPT